MKLLKLNSHPHNYTFFFSHPDYNADESYQPRDYLAATMQFIPGYFACDVVWSTVIYIHPRLKMGPNMGVSRGEWQHSGPIRWLFMAWCFLWKTSKLVFSLVLSAIQALRSVLNAFCVVNRKNMFVYQERTTKSVFYLRWVTSSAFFILVFDQFELFSEWCWYLRSRVNQRSCWVQHHGQGFNSQGVHALMKSLHRIES